MNQGRRNRLETILLKLQELEVFLAVQIVCFVIQTAMTKTSVDNIKQAMYRSGLLKQRVKPVSSPVAANSSLEPTGPQGPMLEIKVRILGQELSYSQFLELFNQMATLRDAMKRPT